MKRTLSAVSAALFGLAILLTSAVPSSFSAPVISKPVQATSSVDQVQYRNDRRYRYNHRHYDRRHYNRHDWNRHYGWSRWDNRGHHRWNHKPYHRGIYTGGPGRSHQ